MENRCRILDAAARVYALLGFRGATTRRIAEEAGVNEVTLFRTFGSKESLIAEALRWRAATAAPASLALPGDPTDPERELVTWATAQLAELRESRAFIRKAMSEMEERPDAAPCAAANWFAADVDLRRYLVRLGEVGFVDWERVGDDHAALPRYEDAFAAGAMLMAALFSDAMGREMRPDMFPQPADRAPALYVRLFLRAIGCRTKPMRVRPARPSVAAERRAPSTDADRPRARAPRRAS